MDFVALLWAKFQNILTRELMPISADGIHTYIYQPLSKNPRFLVYTMTLTFTFLSMMFLTHPFTRCIVRVITDLLRFHYFSGILFLVVI